MRKKRKRLISVFITLSLVLGLCLTGYSATVTYEGPDKGAGIITIENASEGEIYSLYKMLDATYDAVNNSYSYTVAEYWGDFFETGTGAEYFDVDVNGSVTLKEGADLETDSSAMATLAKAALAYAGNEADIEEMLTVTADADGAEFADLPMGWYLVDTTLGSLCSIDTLTDEVKIREKNPTPTLEKQERDYHTDEDWNDADTAYVGDVMTFEVFIRDVAHSSNLCLHDEMSKGLTFRLGTVEVYSAVVDDPKADLYHDETIEWVEVRSEYYQEFDKAYDACEDDCTFEIRFTDGWLDDLPDNTVIKVIYDAEINEDAVDEDGNLWDVETNVAHLSFGVSSLSVRIMTITDTVGFEIRKYTIQASGSELLLDDAEFMLYEDEAHSEAINFIELEDVDGNVIGYEADWNGYYDSDKLTDTIIAGNVFIEGLAEGTYYLKETKAPAGYNLLEDDIVIEIVLEDDGTGDYYEVVTVNGEEIDGDLVAIENNRGNVLPSMGGIGTTIFYIVGSILVICAIAMFIARKRLNKKQ